jgi:cell division protein FtsZ
VEEVEEESTDHVVFNLNEVEEVVDNEEKVVWTLDTPAETIVFDASNKDGITFSAQTEISEEESRPSRDILLSRNRQREQKIREYTQRMKTAAGLTELETEPAFRRQGLKLDNTPHSSESNVSRLSLNTEINAEGEKITPIRPNNPFIFDNPD